MYDLRPLVVAIPKVRTLRPAEPGIPLARPAARTPPIRARSCLGDGAVGLQPSAMAPRLKPFGRQDLDAWQHSVCVCAVGHASMSHPAVTNKHFALSERHLESFQAAPFFVPVGEVVVVLRAPRHHANGGLLCRNVMQGDVDHQSVSESARFRGILRPIRVETLCAVASASDQVA